MGDETTKLTADMAAGHPHAVQTFYEKYFDWMFQQARRATRRDEAFCLDVVQEAVLRVIRNIRKVDSEPRLRAWLRLVVQTTAYDLLRSERRRNRAELAVIPVVGNENPVQFDSAQIEWLAEQIAKLDPQIINIIRLRFEGNWTLARIAEKLGISLGTVDGRLRRAIEVLRDRAAEDFDD